MFKTNTQSHQTENITRSNKQAWCILDQQTTSYILYIQMSPRIQFQQTNTQTEVRGAVRPSCLTINAINFQTMEGHGNAVTCMLVTSRLMYTGSADSTARCWVVEFGDNTRIYKGHRHTVICMKCDKGIRTSIERGGGIGWDTFFCCWAQVV